MSEATPLFPADQLPPAPPSVIGDDGAPRMGLYAGSVAHAAFSALKGEYAASTLGRRLMEKRWQVVCLATRDAMLTLAIIETGYLASGICAIFDRGARRLLVNENPVLPSLCAKVSDEPGDGLSARLLGPGVRARILRSGGRVLVTARWANAAIDLTLDTRKAPSPITAIAPVGGAGRFDFTQKTVLIPAEGEIRAGNSIFPVHGELAGLDYTHGYFARETAWRWAFAAGQQGSRLVAFNLSEGFLQGAGENVAWVDGEPRPVGKVAFTFDAAAPLGPWRLRSEGGALDLAFQPEGYRAQTVDLKIILSKYVQPFGTFSGRVLGVEVDGLAGVTEDHAAKW
jgi:hypothetical protein